MIYHLVPESNFRGSCAKGMYRPDSVEREGFVHCADERSVLAVADDYFAHVKESLLLLEVDSDCLAAETVYEAPSPLGGGGTVHLELAALFPHVYGPIELTAIVGVGVLTPGPQGYRWPSEFVSPSTILSAS